jgi:hypothetical protein
LPSADWIAIQKTGESITAAASRRSADNTTRFSRGDGRRRAATV